MRAEKHINKGRVEEFFKKLGLKAKTREEFPSKDCDRCGDVS